MERIFLSYTYNPAAPYKQETENLIKHIKIMIDAMGLSVLDGMDIGGWAIDSEIQNRITASDGLIAVMTPWQNNQGNIAIPPYVQAEYNIAQAQKKPTIRVIHESLQVQGMFSNHEYIPHSAAHEVKTVLKLMRTISLWKKEAGHNITVEVKPSELGARFDEHNPGHQCQYQLLVDHTYTGWNKAEFWNEPGATFAFIRNVPDESKLQLRLTLGNELWDSPFSDSMGQITLHKRGDS